MELQVVNDLKTSAKNLKNYDKTINLSFKRYNIAEKLTETHQKTQREYKQKSPKSKVIINGELKKTGPKIIDLSEETTKLGSGVMDEKLEDVNERQYKTALVIQDNFDNYIKTGELRQPQPNQKLIKKIIADIDYR